MNVAVIIFLVLAIVTLTPLIGLPSFTLLFSTKHVPAVVCKTRSFRLTNKIISYAWSAVFFVSALLSFSLDGIWGEWFIPLVVMSLLGTTVTILGMRYLPKHIKEIYRAVSCAELFQLMPYGLNIRYARELGRDFTIQFELTGEEVISGALIVKGLKCVYETGKHDNYTTMLECDSKLWLDIANGVEDPIRASVEHKYKVNGDATIMIHLKSLFSNGHKNKPFTSSVKKNLYNEYRDLQPVDIHNVLILYSGMRKEGTSKTLFMAQEFAKGVKEAGGTVEFVWLNDKVINDCLGCFSCWTNRPGTCVYKDDMKELLDKYLAADLVVYASPLYIFSVNGVMKRFMDRLIPLLKPYMKTAEDGHTMHPDRYQDVRPTHALLISAAGFPDVDNNFDGLRTLYKQWEAHNEKSTIRGELLLPAAELISLPEFSDRKQRVAFACRQIGRQIIECGCPDVDLMRNISDTGLTSGQFKSMANTFWANLDAKQSYMSYMPKL